MDDRIVYLDHSATTAVREEVVEAMLPFFSEKFGNASSVHQFGQRAQQGLTGARETIAALIGASAEEIIFTSGGSESDNLAVKGAAAARVKKGRHIVTSSVEHLAVLGTCKHLEKEGFEVTFLPVDRGGLVDAEALRGAIRADTVLVSIMLGNNEVGTVQPIPELSALAREAGVPFHTDAVQAVGKIPVNVDELGVDMMSVSAHKFYGPKGVGFLYLRKGTRITPVQHGGHHEKNRRAGTENVAGIVGMARALELACEEMAETSVRLARLRDRLERGILDSIEQVSVNGHRRHRLPNITNVSFHGIEGESILFRLDAEGIAASTGSACTSGTLEPSHVLMAMGVPPEISHGSIRFSLGRANTEEDIEYVLKRLPPVVEGLREMSPFWDQIKGRA